MDETLDRRNVQRERVPLRLSAELGHGDFEDPFAADVVNLSKGGLSMRAACLPDIGSRLSCRFRCVPSGALVCAEGEVVWAHLDGENSGEFGLAFVDLDPKTEWLIEEMIAEQVACGGGALARSPVDVAAPVTTLVLEGSREAIDARLALDGDDVAVFEQELQLLRVGRGVRAETDGFGGRSGSIAAVQLRMVGSVPMLAVTVEFAPHTALPATRAMASAEQLALPMPELPHDTEPDLHAPEATSDADLDAVLGAAPQLSASEAFPDPEPEVGSALEPHAPSIAARSTAQAAHARDVSVSFQLQKRDAQPAAPAADAGDYDPDLDFEAMVRPAWKPAVDRLLAGVARVVGALSAVLSSRVARDAMPQVRGGAFRTAAFVRAVYGKTLAPQFGALRRLLAGAIAVRRRRTTTAGRAQGRDASGSLGRTFAVGLLGAGAAGFAVYALMPSDGDRIELHRSVQTEQAKPAAAPSADPRPSSGAPAAKTPGTLARSAAPDPRAVPSAASVPPGSPFAVDVRGARPAEAKPAAGKPLRFGAASVPKARKYTLRMSTKVQNLSGVADNGGFTITALGSLSLDRAGPIASTHKAVARAMIINRGDRAELSIRFADGKRPAYQVSAEGATLYVLIEDT